MDIGRSEGLKVRFEMDGPAVAGEATIEVFTTRPDTLYGMSFLGTFRRSSAARALSDADPAIAAFCEECRRIGTSAAALEQTAEKKGLATGLSVKHPFNGKSYPVYIANFVLMDYGTGAILLPGA